MWIGIDLQHFEDWGFCLRLQLCAPFSKVSKC